MMALLLPLSAALTLPVAALFSAAATYGRLSADNEFVACRSSGINIHLLFLPTLLLSLVSAGISFGLTNYLIPGMVRNLDELVYADLGSLFQQRLSRPRGVSLGRGVRIYADESTTDATDPARFTVYRVAFLQVENEAWVRFGTARQLQLQFARGEDHVRVAGRMIGLSYFDRKLGQFVEEAQQAIPANEIPSLIQQEFKFLNLNELLYYYAHPERWRAVRQRLGTLRKAEGRWLLFDTLEHEWISRKHRITLADDRVAYEIRSQSANRSRTDGYLELIQVNIEERKDSRSRMITADKATLEVTRGDTLADSGVQLKLQNASLSSGGIVLQREKETLGPVAIAPDLIARVEAMTDEALLTPRGGPQQDPLFKLRMAARAARAESVRRIVGTICERTAFSVSVFVLVILGAALGMIFRGSHVMTAFGISFVPALFVLIAIVMGRQMARNEGTYSAGLLVMWGGIVIVAVLDVLMLTQRVRR
jgi:lipopolysaccharide export LptBFGC system permease protein LptF